MSKFAFTRVYSPSDFKLNDRQVAKIKPIFYSNHQFFKDHGVYTQNDLINLAIGEAKKMLSQLNKKPNILD